ncbi:MAG: hypothetical protein RJA70_1298 [Pseudomonadota bacterium]|jgi:glycosyltransferase involved in cell wall biosynthesis
MSAVGEAPLVSTIIPTYNRSVEVLRAVRSALCQTYDRQEVLVVDDGSTDDTEAQLSSHFGTRIRYLKKANGGVSAARNFGMREARGEFIAFLDSDDEWRSDKLRLQVEFLTAHPEFGLVVTDIEWVDPNGETTRVERRREHFPASGDVLASALREPTITPSTAMLRKRVVDEVGEFDVALKTAEDIEYYLRIARRYKVGLIDQALTKYMAGHESLSAPSGAFVDYVRVMEKFIDDNADRITAVERRQALFSTYERCARGLTWMSNYGAAAKLSLRAVPQVRDSKQALQLARAAGRLLYYSVRSRVENTQTKGHH